MRRTPNSTLTHQPCRFDKFAFDITDLLQPGDEQSLQVAVYDPTEFGHIALGKQRLHPPRHPSSIWYTSNTGIWQTVWLEPVRQRASPHSECVNRTCNTQQ